MLKKSLAFCASMYCDQYTFWKDDGREWDPSLPEEQHWTYNCTDCVRTFEVAENLENIIDKKGLREQFKFQHERLYDPVFRMMLRGVKVNEQQLTQFALEVNEAQARVHQYVLDVTGEDDLNPGSNKRLQQIVYDECRVKPVYKKETGQPTLDKNAIPIIQQREPILAPMLEAVKHYRSLGVYAGNFLAPGKVGRDGRFHTFYKMAGAYTYRFASAEDAFGSGLSLQNIPRNRDEEDKKRKGGWRQMLEDIAYPPVRGLFRPDHGMILLDSDLERADAQVVAWESDDEILKQIFREGLDIHTENARLIYNTGKPTDRERQLAKSACHAVNYVCKARTLAKTLGITVREAEAFITRWFDIHPGILDWHQRVEDQLMTTRTIKNIFGYEVMFFDRIDDLLADAVAWIGQSTVALVINHALCNVAENLPWVELLMQVHDSLVMQVPMEHVGRIKEIEQQLLIPVPYADPLVIPVGTKGSNDNWAVCKKLETYG
jgi:DNA polymerase-1